MSQPLVLFWKADEENGWLSNWSPHGFTENDVTFRTAEHYLMYHKAMLMGDEACAKQIIRARTPLAAKELGRCVQNWDEQKWVDTRSEIICRGLRLKIDAHPELKEALAGTGWGLIAEASPYDRIWGIGLGGKSKRAENPQLWQGANLLGKAWMTVRGEIITNSNPNGTDERIEEVSGSTPHLA